jgi:glutamine synthetase
MIQDPAVVDERLVRGVLELATDQGVKFVNLQFTDIVGMVKSVTIPVTQLEDTVRHGKWFDGSSIEGFARIAESDMHLMPELATFAIIPWERGENTTARLICRVYTPEGRLFPGDPRFVLSQAISEANELGYDFRTGPEPEFFLFKGDGGDGGQLSLYDSGGYFDLSSDPASDVRKEMVNALIDLKINVETSHHEGAPGQHEIDFEYDDALTSADNVVTFKYTLKAIAQRHGLHATFMPKPVYGINGNGMHVHQSLFRKGTSENAFHDPSDPYGLSGIARHFIAGQLQHARGMSAVLAPLVNSYKRLVPGYEAPVYISWARINRSALIRVPKPVLHHPQATRIELRCPDPSCNPYLAFAVMLKAGLDGIRGNLVCPKPVEENLYHLDSADRQRLNLKMLPGSLNEAIQELKKDELIKKALGDHVYERFVEAKELEWAEYKAQVTDWELKRYLAVF